MLNLGHALAMVLHGRKVFLLLAAGKVVLYSMAKERENESMSEREHASPHVVAPGP